MTWHKAGRALHGGGVALALGAIATLAQPASAQYERKLAGIRLNSTSSAVLRAFGNPNEVVIGDVGIRQGPGTAGGGGQANAGGFGEGGPATSSFGGSGSYSPGRGTGKTGALSAISGSGSPMSSSGPPAGYGGFGGSSGPSASSSYGSGGGPRSSYGPPTGGSFGGSGGGGFGDDSPGLGGGSAGYGGRGGSGGGVGQFGQTTSTLARTQEVTWIYNRKIGNNLVSYEFLIGPGGQVTQIRVSGYSGGNSTTGRSIKLGNTYKDVVRAYGFPEEHYQVGRILVASYKKRAHVQFQFLNERGTANQNLNGNKVVAITVAAVE